MRIIYSVCVAVFFVVSSVGIFGASNADSGSDSPYDTYEIELRRFRFENVNDSDLVAAINNLTEEDVGLALSENLMLLNTATRSSPPRLQLLRFAAQVRLLLLPKARIFGIVT